MSRQVRFGIVGTGRVGQLGHLWPLSQLPDARVVALAELRRDLGRQVAQRYGVERLYPTHRELLADHDVDAVVVVTRREHTAGVVRDALRAGRHVLSEKPMAQNIDDARQLVALANERGVRYAVGYMKRSDEVVQQLRERVQSARRTGDHGALRQATFRMCSGDDGAAAADWIMTQEPRPGNGMAGTEVDAEIETFLNVYSHATNLARYLLGESLRPQRVARFSEMTVDAATPAGVAVRFVLADRRAGDWDESAMLEFERAVVRITLPPPFARNRRVVAEIEGSRGKQTLTSPSWAFFRQAERFCRAVRLGEALIAPGSDAVNDIAFAMEAMQTAS